MTIDTYQPNRSEATLLLAIQDAETLSNNMLLLMGFDYVDTRPLEARGLVKSSFLGYALTTRGENAAANAEIILTEIAN